MMLRINKKDNLQLGEREIGRKAGETSPPPPNVDTARYTVGSILLSTIDQVSSQINDHMIKDNQEIIKWSEMTLCKGQCNRTDNRKLISSRQKLRLPQQTLPSIAPQTLPLIA